jgi:hypothetical protein
MPHGITQAETIGIAARLAMTPNGDMRWKWYAVNGRSAREHRYQSEPYDLAPSPERNARGERRIGAPGHKGQFVLVAGNERKGCRKGHLEAWMHDRLRRQQQHAYGGNRDDAEGQALTVNHHPDEHNRNHDERALRGESTPSFVSSERSC